MLHQRTFVRQLKRTHGEPLTPHLGPTNDHTHTFQTVRCLPTQTAEMSSASPACFHGDGDGDGGGEVVVGGDGLGGGGDGGGGLGVVVAPLRRRARRRRAMGSVAQSLRRRRAAGSAAPATLGCREGYAAEPTYWGRRSYPTLTLSRVWSSGLSHCSQPRLRRIACVLPIECQAALRLERHEIRGSHVVPICAKKHNAVG